MYNETDRFNEAIEYLINNKVVKSKAEISRAFDITPQKLTDILKKRIRPNFHLFNMLSEKYNFNPQWLLTGTGLMLKTETKPVDNSGLQECLAEKERLQSDIEMLKQSLKVNHKYIANLEKENKELKATLKKLQAVNKDQPKEQSGHT